jgi:hypothetical protein
MAIFRRNPVIQPPNGCCLTGLDDHGKVGFFGCYWHSQVRSDRCRGLHLLQPVTEVDVGYGILCCVVVGIAFGFVILDLQACRYSLLTEGNLVPSATADNEPGRQVKLISPDCLAHHLSHSHGWRMATVPKLHHPIAVAIITNHIDIYGILDGA